MYHSNLGDVSVHLLKYDDVCLIDADIVAFRFAVLNEDSLDWGDGVTTDLSDLPRALTEAKAFVAWLVDQCQGFPVLCFTGSNNFRKTEYVDYKSNRKEHDKPDMLSALKDALSENFYSVKHDDLEADDVLGILQSNRFKNTSTIATIDKDLDQIEGWHFNWNRNDTYETTRDSGERFFWRQVLTGDAVDGYKGCYLCGPKGADALLDTVKLNNDYFKVVYTTYIEREMKRKDTHDYSTHDLAYLISQARCALMLTADMFDFTTNKPIMWQPPYAVYENLEGKELIDAHSV